MSDYFYPRLTEVQALPNFRLQTTWTTGEILTLTVFDQLSKHGLREILKPEVFNTVHISEWGQAVEWFDEEFGADNVYAWAKEQAGEVSHEMFDNWMQRNQLSLSTAAQSLGVSRRMVSYYRTAQKTIPRAIWLACLGWEITKPKDKLPYCLPTAQHYASLHA